MFFRFNKVGFLGFPDEVAIAIGKSMCEKPPKDPYVLFGRIAALGYLAAFHINPEEEYLIIENIKELEGTA